MPTHLTFQQHLAGLHEATLHLTRHATAAGLDVAVPTCPEWTVRRLIGHQGRVHRWSSAVLKGEQVDAEAVEKAGRSNPDPVEWLRDGVIALVTALVESPEDVDAPVFLHDAPAPRLFWARRQHHETLMHALDVLGADLGRLPRADETWVGVDAALDGIDELVMGFVPRSRSPLRVAEGVAPTTIAIRTPDAAHSWTVRVSEEPPVVVRHDGAAEGDLVIEGPAVALYLALWHRGDEATGDGLALWERMTV